MRRDSSLSFACVALLVVACATGEGTDGVGAGGNGGFGNVSGTGGASSGGGTGGSPAGGAAGSGGTAGSGAAGGVAGSGGAPSGGGGGTGDGGLGWPTCDSPPSGVPQKTLAQIWSDNPAKETQVWVPGVFVTAISGAGCVANSACQVFVQQAESYPTLAAAAKQAIKLRIASTVAQHFGGLKVGDKVDVLGHAWRYALGGVNELVIQINSQLPGCAKKVGNGNPVPVTGVQLGDLSVAAYEQTHGPVLIQISTVSGKPAGSKEIFGLWKTGVGIGDAGPESLVNASPFFLPNNAFVGLPTTGTDAVSFKTVSGVFAVFVPSTDGGTAPKYKVVYPRTMGEMAQ
ncbi:MAG: hypothetical protein IT377_02290 [Polyangiaceae bacterium]|nr:hypothetical protein [Polyangiaceae bacterium]